MKPNNYTIDEMVLDLSLIRRILNLEDPLELKVTEATIFPPESVNEEYIVHLHTVEGSILKLKALKIHFSGAKVSMALNKSNVSVSINGKGSIRRIALKFKDPTLAVFDNGILSFFG